MPSVKNQRYVFFCLGNQSLWWVFFLLTFLPFLHWYNNKAGRPNVKSKGYPSFSKERIDGPTHFLTIHIMWISCAKEFTVSDPWKVCIVWSTHFMRSANTPLWVLYSKGELVGVVDRNLIHTIGMNGEAEMAWSKQDVYEKRG